MDRTLRTMGMVGLALFVGALGGYAAGRYQPVPSTEVIQELRRQGVQLERLREGVVALVERPVAATVNCAGNAAGDPATVQASIEKGVQRAFDDRARQAEVERAQRELPTPENDAAHEKGEQIIRNAIAGKRWTGRDVASLRPLMARMRVSRPRASSSSLHRP